MGNSLSDTEKTILLGFASAGGADSWLTANEIAKRARAKKHELTITTTYRVLSKISLRSFVEYKTIRNIRRFHLKQKGVEVTGISKGEAASFVVAGTSWSSQRELRDFLGKEAVGSLLIIDPYISEDTLDVLGKVSIPIKIAAVNLGRRGKEAEFLRALKKFSAEKKGAVEVRKCSHADLHGRYIFTDQKGWVIDHSLQDIGSKPAIIMPLHLEAIYPEVRDHFSSIFLSGAVIP